jgi:hypothetical protein
MVHLTSNERRGNTLEAMFFAHGDATNVSYKYHAMHASFFHDRCVRLIANVSSSDKGPDAKLGKFKNTCDVCSTRSSITLIFTLYC